MKSEMQDWSLTLEKLLDHARRWHGSREVVSREPGGGLVRSTYAQVHARAKQVSHALLEEGVRAGDRVATLAWNGHRHLEAWYGAVGIGAVLHTVNPRLFVDQIIYIVNHAQDRLILADPACAELLERILPSCPDLRSVVFLCHGGQLPRTTFKAVAYEEWIAHRPQDAAWGEVNESDAAGLCYTSGTTGDPKGVLYSHRSNYLHAMMSLQPDALNLSATDTVMLTVPMYHANAWGMVYSAPMVGAKLVLPGQKLDGASVHELMLAEEVTYAAGVPTLWQMLLTHLKERGGGLPKLKRVSVGGAACPESLIRAFHDDYGVEVIQIWGMTETSPVCTVSSESPATLEMTFDQRIAYRLKAGRPLCNVDLKLVDEDGRPVPHDGRTPGRLMVAGPTIAGGYYRSSAPSPIDADGYLDTGDICTLDGEGYLQITDRAKDIIKSGGEWISSVDIENIAAAHPKAAICAVIGVPHPKWDERPVLVVQLRPGASADRAEMLGFLEAKIAKWWTPDEVIFIDDMPLGPTGKINKRELRSRLSARAAILTD